MREIHKIFPDAKLPTERQRQKLCELIYHALLKIRVLGWSGKSEQAADLADAFHNLPVMLWSEDFSLDYFRKYLESYQQKYPDDKGTDYLKLVDQIIDEEN